jgi:hypothetical protein
VATVQGEPLPVVAPEAVAVAMRVVAVAVPGVVAVAPGAVAAAALGRLLVAQRVAVSVRRGEAPRVPVAGHTGEASGRVTPVTCSLNSSVACVLVVTI